MRIFITGATGFIGMNLALELADSGHIVHALCRSKEKARSLNHPNIRIYEGDILNNKSIEKAIQDCTSVYHLAAYAKIWSKDPTTSYRVNVTGTNNILDACLKHQIKKVVVTSSAAIFGPSLNGELVNETTWRKNDFFTEYERTKFESIQYIKQYVEKGLNIVVVYPTRVFGPGLLTQSNVVTSMIQWFVERRINYVPGNTVKIGNYAYIKDVVNGHILAMEQGKPGEHYILGGQNLSYKQIYELLNRIKPKWHFLFGIPSEILKTASFIFQILNKLMGTAPIVTNEWINKYNYNWKCSSRKAETELGYKITPMEVGLNETITWLSDGAKRIKKQRE